MITTYRSAAPYTFTQAAMSSKKSKSKKIKRRRERKLSKSADAKTTTTTTTSTMTMNTKMITRINVELIDLEGYARDLLAHQENLSQREQELEVLRQKLQQEQQELADRAKAQEQKFKELLELLKAKNEALGARKNKVEALEQELAENQSKIKASRTVLDENDEIIGRLEQQVIAFDRPDDDMRADEQSSDQTTYLLPSVQDSDGKTELIVEEAIAPDDGGTLASFTDPTLQVNGISFEADASYIEEADGLATVLPVGEEDHDTLFGISNNNTDISDIGINDDGIFYIVNQDGGISYDCSSNDDIEDSLTGQSDFSAVEADFLGSDSDTSQNPNEFRG